MICTDCIFAYTDPNDDQDIYSCPFDHEYCFHSNEQCHYPREYRYYLQLCREEYKLYDIVSEAEKAEEELHD